MSKVTTIDEEVEENDHLGRTWHHVLLEAGVEHGDSSGGSLDRVRLVTCREDGRDCPGEKPKVGQNHLSHDL